jgi:hypothetical protein
VRPAIRSGDEDRSAALRCARRVLLLASVAPAAAEPAAAAAAGAVAVRISPGVVQLGSLGSLEGRLVSVPVAGTEKVKLTGLTQNLQVDPAVRLKIPIRALELTQMPGQPCEFQVLDTEAGMGGGSFALRIESGAPGAR